MIRHKVLMRGSEVIIPSVGGTGPNMAWGDDIKFISHYVDATLQCLQFIRIKLIYFP